MISHTITFYNHYNNYFDYQTVSPFTSNHHFLYLSPSQIPAIPYKSSISATSPRNPLSNITHQKNFKFPYKIKIFSKSLQIPTKLTFLDYICKHSNQQKSLKIKAFSNIQSLSHRTHVKIHTISIKIKIANPQTTLNSYICSI